MSNKHIRRLMSLLVAAVLIFSLTPLALAAEAEYAAKLDDTADSATGTSPPVTVTEEITTEPTANTDTAAPPDTEGNPTLYAAGDSYGNIEYHWQGTINYPESERYGFAWEGQWIHMNAASLHFVTVNSTKYPAYCVDPPTHQDSDYTGSESAGTDAAWGDLTLAQRRAVGLAILYGYPNGLAPNGNTLDEYQMQAATQIIINEIYYGYRSAADPGTVTDTRIKELFDDNGTVTYNSWDGDSSVVTDVDKYYNIIDQALKGHSKYLSFSNPLATLAPTITLYPNSSGKYTATVTDTNGILSKYTFTNTDQYTFTKSGNQLTITADAPFGTVLQQPVKYVPSLERQSFIVMQGKNDSGAQALVADTVKEIFYDPVPSYFNIRTSEGQIKITKSLVNTNDPALLKGWKFGVYTDAGCTQEIAGSPFFTDANGEILVKGLSPGTTYYVREYSTGHEIEGGFNAWVWTLDTNVRTITLTAGQTKEINPANTYKGSIQLRKYINGVRYSAENWDPDLTFRFHLWSDETGYDGYYTVDTTGWAGWFRLNPGRYYLQEVYHEDNPYWTYDTKIYTIDLEAGEVYNHVHNNYYGGKIQVLKSTNTGEDLEGWKFGIYNSSNTLVETITTDDTGYAISSVLQPGNYTVKEIDGPSGKWGSDYWVCDTTSHSVTVAAEATSTVSVTNNQYGKIQIQKATNTGKDLEGWIFGIYNSGNTLVETVTTNANGVATSKLLAAGKYTVKEIGGPSGMWGSEYWVCDTNGYAVTVENGKTVSSGVVTNYNYGKIEIVKNTTSGQYLEGWKFGIYTDSACTKPITGSPFTTGADGKIVVSDLTEGTYYIKELAASEQDFNGFDSAYWQIDGTVRTVNLTASTKESVEVTNVHGGRIDIQKFINDAPYLDHKFETPVTFTFHLWSDETGFDQTGTIDNTGALSFYPLEPGVYYLQETDPGDPSWTCDTEIYTIEVEANETYGHKHYNYTGGKIQVQKVTNTGKDLDGWIFGIYDADNELVEQITSDAKGIATSGLLPAGEYTVREIGGPSGKWGNAYWECDSTGFDITLKAAETATVTIRNNQMSDIKIIKTTNDGKNLSGWQFEIYKVNGTTKTLVDTVYSGNDGTIVSDKLEPGTYEIREIIPANSDYYCEGTATQTVRLAAGKTTEVFYHNIRYGKILVQKTTNTTDPADLGYWPIWLYVDAKCVNPIAYGSTDATGKLLFDKIRPGTYYVREQNFSDPYFDLDTEIKQVIVVSGETAQINIHNNIYPVRIQVSKIDPLGTKLSGATFLLEWSQDGKRWQPIKECTTEGKLTYGECTANGLTDGCLTTDSSGVIAWENLHPALYYRVTEVEAPDGYVKLADYAFNGRLNRQNKEINITVVNSKGYILPASGVLDSGIPLIFGAALAALALAAMLLMAIPPVNHSQSVILKTKMKGSVKMKKSPITRMLSLLLCICMVLGMATTAFAAEIADATIHMDEKGSLTVYAYDWTNAAKDGIWTTESYVSTGQSDSYINAILGSTSDPSNLGNGQTSNGYAIAGVEYTYLQVAEFYQFSQSEKDGGRTDSHVEMLFKFDKTLAADLLKAIGLENGLNSYANANALDGTAWYYQSDVVSAALKAALTTNATTVKDALEAYVKANSGTAMPLTDANGKTQAEDLSVGLYLLVQTKVPEHVTATTSPFFVALPMTNVNGGSNDGDDTNDIADGGHSWLYDVTVYPKSDTGIVTLEKSVREALKDTATHGGSTTDITDGYLHYATASAGDTVEYQIISTLPSITSTATNIAEYTFRDLLARGLSYDSATPVMIEWFKDAACTNKVTTWNAADGKFTVQQVENTDGSHTMTITMTAAGLAEINTANTTANNSNGSLYAGYSNYTMRITYAAVLNSDESLVYGDEGNCNEIVLTWRRSSSEYYDTLIDDCHVFTYGIDLTKKFSDGKTDQALFDHVLFKAQNATDGYYVIAALNEDEGIWYVTGHTELEEEATAIYPVTWNEKPGQIVIKGLEDNEYILTEIETADDYLLLKESITVAISAADDAARPCNVYSKDNLGVIQNDPRFSFDGGMDLKLANIPQAAMAHNLLTASATVDGNAVTMLADEADTDSTNALVPLEVVNTRGWELAPTGEFTTILMGAGGGAACLFAIFGLIFAFLPKRKNEENEQ